MVLLLYVLCNVNFYLVDFPSSNIVFYHQHGSYSNSISRVPGTGRQLTTNMASLYRQSYTYSQQRRRLLIALRITWQTLYGIGYDMHYSERLQLHSEKVKKSYNKKYGMSILITLQVTYWTRNANLLDSKRLDGRRGFMNEQAIGYKHNYCSFAKEMHA